jgi:acetate kinase
MPPVLIYLFLNVYVPAIFFYFSGITHMQVLVINSGSSSIKLEVFDMDNRRSVHGLRAEKIPAQPTIKLDGAALAYTGELSFDAVLEFCLRSLASVINGKIDAIGHRVVHGGTEFIQPTRLHEAVLAKLETLIPLVPLHLPANLAGIRMAEKLFPEIPNIAVFDTAFHQTLPSRARQYAIPKALAEKHRIRRYGFHGMSHKFVAEQAAAFLKTDWMQLRMITCHLGNGASVCAIEFGRSVEVSMGMSALEGLVMGTRSGDIDPGLFSYIARQENISLEAVEEILYKKSGLLGLSGTTNDMRDILAQAEAGNEDCRTAIQVFCHRLKKYIGAFTAVMGGMDVLVFTGGIGENSAEIRNRVCQHMELFGIIMDEDRNRDVKLTDANNAALISAGNSRVHVLAVLTDEELSIAHDTQKIITELNKVNTEKKIPIAVSARHVHLCRETLDALFGKGYELTPMKPLSQPGQFAANETVTLTGPKNKIEQVRILGPLRPKDQVEISRTDEFFLGLDAPVRESGHTENTPGMTLTGPYGSAHLQTGVICAWRHIHMHPDDAKEFGVQDKDIVSVDVDDPDRPLTFHNVLIRVSDKFRLEMHIDTDEGNAAEIRSGETGELLLTKSEGKLLKRHV